MTIITLHHLCFGHCVNSSVIVLVLCIFLRELRSLRKIPRPKTITSDFHTMTSKKIVRSYYCLNNLFSSKFQICLCKVQNTILWSGLVIQHSTHINKISPQAHSQTIHPVQQFGTYQLHSCTWAYLQWSWRCLVQLLVPVGCPCHRALCIWLGTGGICHLGSSQLQGYKDDIRYIKLM